MESSEWDERDGRLRHEGMWSSAAGAAEIQLIARGFRLTAGEIIIGTVAATMLTRLMGNMLYNVSPRDPLAFGLACFVMAIVALIALFQCSRGAPHASIPFKLYERECFGH
jgi:hypothetical protein